LNSAKTAPISGSSLAVPISGSSLAVPISGSSLAVPISGSSLAVPISGSSLDDMIFEIINRHPNSKDSYVEFVRVTFLATVGFFLFLATVGTILHISDHLDVV
jgi:hypothetical protein